MDKQHGLNNINDYNVINLDTRELGVIQRKASICFKISGVMSKLSELENNNVNIDYNIISNKINFLFMNINDDIYRLRFIDKELDIIINNLDCYSNSVNIIKHL